MVIEFRLYKRFDADLIALCNAGYPISVMIREAVIGYANGYPVHFYVDEVTHFDTVNNKTIRSRFTVPNTDTKTCYMLKHILPSYRNSFVKIVLRNALVQQNLSCFFTDGTLNRLQADNINGRNIYGFSNLSACSTLKSEPKQITFAGQTITVDRKKRKSSVKSTAVNTGQKVLASNESQAEYNPFTGAVSYQPVQMPQSSIAAFIPRQEAPQQTQQPVNIYQAPPAQITQAVPPVQLTQQITQPVQSVQMQPVMAGQPIMQAPVKAPTVPVQTVAPAQAGQIQEVPQPEYVNPDNEKNIGPDSGAVVGLADNDALMNIFDSL
jgi:hypothetical protein